jgi:hypothetical protein
MVEKPAEQVLMGGNVAGRVVRAGPTVRKPVTRATPAVEALLRHLADTLPPMTAAGLRRWGPAADYIDRHHGQWLAALLS